VTGRCRVAGADSSTLLRCRSESDDALAVVRHGAALLSLVVAAVLHAGVSLAGVLLCSSVVCRPQQVLS